MNHTDQLAQSLRTRHIVMIALGGVVGAGFFIGSSSALALAGPMVLVSYVLCGLFVFLSNLMMRDLALAIPGRHSFLGQIYHSLGERMAFIAGWTYWVTWVTVIAVEVIAITNMLEAYIPLRYVVLECLVLGATLAVNLFSVRGYAECEYWFASIKIFAIVAFIGIGLWLLIAVPIPVRENLVHHGGLLPRGLRSLFAVLPTILFSMGGSELATIAAVESNDTSKNIARAARTIPLRIGTFYLLTISLILCLVPWSEVVPGQSPFLLVLSHFQVPFAGSALYVVILTAAFSSLNSGMYATSRILYEMAKRGSAPSVFLNVDQKTKLPRQALSASVGVAVLIAATAVLSPNIIFAALVSITGAFMLVYNGIIIVARLKLVREQVWMGWLALLLIACVFLSMLMQTETRLQIEIGSAALVVILGCERLGHVMKMRKR